MSQRSTRAVLLLVASVLLILVLRNAWVCDDAYITFRTLDNLASGHGLRWNVDERVQAYTHPLWLLLHVPFHWLTGEFFFTTIAISTALSIAAFVVATGLLAERPLWLALLAALPLLFSQAFLDFATSGLENPLTFLLLALFALRLLGREDPLPFALSLLTALAAVNRLDALLFFMPALLHALARRGRRSLVPAMLGFTPLVAWEAFSLFYYGFLLPNTRYAKLPSNAALAWHLENGRAYAVNLVQRDPVSACVLAAGLALAAALGVAWAAGRVRGRAPKRVVKPALLGLGMACGVIYAVAVGGDFMQGRFFAVPVFAATLLLWSALPRGRGDLSPGWVAAALAVAGLLVLRALAAEAPWFQAGRGIVDERAFYAETNTLESRLSGSRVRDHERARQGLAARERAAELARSGSGERWVETATAIGMLGYFAGPDVVVVDQMALADPLLARLPAWRPLSMRAGHPRRQLPKGYLESRRTGSLAGFDPGLRVYYAALRRIVRDPLLDPGRLAEIGRFNLGIYDPLLEAYLAKRRIEPPKPSRRRRGPG